MQKALSWNCAHCVVKVLIHNTTENAAAVAFCCRLQKLNIICPSICSFCQLKAPTPDYNRLRPHMVKLSQVLTKPWSLKEKKVKCTKQTFFFILYVSLTFVKFIWYWMTIKVFWNMILFLWANIYCRFEDYNAFIFRFKPFKRTLLSLLSLFYPEDEGNRIFHTVGAVYPFT